MPHSQHQTATDAPRLPVDARQLDALLLAYAHGEIDLKKLEAVSGLWFGDILAELGRRGLRLPLVDSRQHYSPKQQQLYERLFS